jgi:hypothetical protein
MNGCFCGDSYGLSSIDYATSKRLHVWLRPRVVDEHPAPDEHHEPKQRRHSQANCLRFAQPNADENCGQQQNREKKYDEQPCEQRSADAVAWKQASLAFSSCIERTAYEFSDNHPKSGTAVRPHTNEPNTIGHAKVATDAKASTANR